ncbi:MAG: hypothetical protein WDZ70_00525 [Candidatus Paceibacterota bacterium]
MALYLFWGIKKALCLKSTGPQWFKRDRWTPFSLLLSYLYEELKRSGYPRSLKSILDCKRNIKTQLDAPILAKTGTANDLALERG